MQPRQSAARIRWGRSTRWSKRVPARPIATCGGWASFTPLEVPCTPPPWGTIAGIDLQAGEVVWQVPLGTTRDLAPFPLGFIDGAYRTWADRSQPRPGSALSRPTSDHYLRAFDSETGAEAVARAPAHRRTGDTDDLSHGAGRLNSTLSSQPVATGHWGRRPAITSWLCPS